MKTKKIISMSIVIILAIAVILLLPNNSQKALADHQTQEISTNLIELSDSCGERGLFTVLSLSERVENGEFIATARNDFTLFNSKVEVFVMLYSSTTYHSSYINMSLESSNYIADLNMGESISAIAAINGVKRYWQARIYYKVDNKDWAEKLSDVWLVEADGTASIV